MTQLYSIATEIDDSKFLDDDIPNRKPDQIEKKWNGETHIWDLGNGREFRIEYVTLSGTSSNGTKLWYFNGKPHREDGPAVKYADGSTNWRLNGNLHREDGPAIERPNGDNSWWLNGKQIKSKDYNTPRFKQRWQKLLKLEGIRQIMED